jgi:glycosyltransferase involved in cell wall biosynthesis
MEGASTGRRPIKIAIITPTIGTGFLERCVASVQAQDMPNVTHWIVVDGPEHEARVRVVVDTYKHRMPIEVMVLPRNVGKEWYGHRVYAAMPFLVDADTDFVAYLDEDNELEPGHVRHLSRGVVGADSRVVCEDRCESLGGIAPAVNDPHDRLIDTSCFLLRKDLAIEIAPVWHGKYAQDRVVTRWLLEHEPVHAVSRRHTVRYRVSDKPGSVTSSFFVRGNSITGYDFTKPDVYAFAPSDALSAIDPEKHNRIVLEDAPGDPWVPAGAWVVASSPSPALQTYLRDRPDVWRIKYTRDPVGKAAKAVPGRTEEDDDELVWWDVCVSTPDKLDDQLSNRA